MVGEIHFLFQQQNGRYKPFAGFSYWSLFHAMLGRKPIEE